MRLVACVLFVLLSLTPVRAQAPLHYDAFFKFIKDGNFQQANFYLTQGFIQTDGLDTSEIYFRIIVDHLRSPVETRLDAYQYLSALNPIDLNREFLCRSERNSNSKDYSTPCVLVNQLAQGSSVTDFQFFVEKGLDLNKIFPSQIPATFPIINHLGGNYSLQDINQLTAMDMVFGDETYNPAFMFDRTYRNVDLPKTPA